MMCQFQGYQITIDTNGKWLVRLNIGWWVDVEGELLELHANNTKAYALQNEKLLLPCEGLCKWIWWVRKFFPSLLWFHFTPKRWQSDGKQYPLSRLMHVCCSYSKRSFCFISAFKFEIDNSLAGAVIRMYLGELNCFVTQLSHLLTVELLPLFCN